LKVVEKNIRIKNLKYSLYIFFLFHNILLEEFYVWGKWAEKWRNKKKILQALKKYLIWKSKEQQRDDDSVKEKNTSIGVNFQRHLKLKFNFHLCELSRVRFVLQSEDKPINILYNKQTNPSHFVLPHPCRILQ
jgi:hypothetical protein